MPRPTLVYVHGAGESTSDGRGWIDDIARALQRCGYDIDEDRLAERTVSPSYTTHLQEHVAPTGSQGFGDLPTRRASSSHEARADFAERQLALTQSLPPDFPADEAIVRTLRRAAGNDRLVGAFARRRVPDAARYAESEARREAVRRAVAIALDGVSGEIVLVGHSLGSVIALDLLSRLPENVQVSRFVTIGSPLGLPIFKDLVATWAPAFPYDATETWINFYDPDDPVTGGSGVANAITKAGGPDVVDHVVENGSVVSNHGSTRYLDHLVVAHHLGPVLAPSDRGHEPLEREPAMRQSWRDAALRAGVRRHLVDRTDDERQRARRAAADLYLVADVVAQLGIHPVPNLELPFESTEPPNEAMCRRTMIELLEAEPFAPFGTPTTLEERHEAVRPVAPHLGFDDEQTHRAYRAVSTALGCQERSRSTGATVVVAAAVVALAAPGLMVGLAAAPGLAGAAALTSGLATLGGGSMAAGLAATAATGAVTTAVAGFALERMSVEQAIDSLVRMHAEAILLLGNGDRGSALNVTETVSAMLYEASRMAREHRVMDETGDRADGYDDVSTACRRALEDLRERLFPT